MDILHFFTHNQRSRHLSQLLGRANMRSQHLSQGLASAQLYGAQNLSSQHLSQGLAGARLGALRRCDKLYDEQIMWRFLPVKCI